jgi:hypothetical protein
MVDKNPYKIFLTYCEELIISIADNSPLYVTSVDGASGILFRLLFLQVLHHFLGHLSLHVLI